MDGQTVQTPKRRLFDYKHWAYGSLFSAIIVGLSYLYYGLTGEGAEGNRFYSQLTADAGTILIAISMMMSGFSYYLDIFDKKLVYRRHIGVIGFLITLVHIYVTVIFAAERPQIALSSFTNVIAFILGCFALAMFIQMTLVSNNFSIRLFGNKAWRLFLRYIGYSALIITLVHFFLKKLDVWEMWLKGDMDVFPPLSFITLIVTLITIILRLSLVFSLRKDEKEEAAVATTS